MEKNILRISILPLIVLTILGLSDLQQHGNNKGEKGNKEQGQGNDKPEQGNKGNDHGNGQMDKHSQGNAKAGNGDRENEHGNMDKGKSDHDNRTDNGKDKSYKMNDYKGNKNGNGHREVISWAKDHNINWDFNNFPSRKRPHDMKKVTICHSTGSYPVTINISENALQAHLNHGDRIGNCAVNYGERWTPVYIRTRENVYNTYEQTWETMSYSEALLRYAAEKLLGVKTNLNNTRATLTPVEVQRREVLILDLQNNVNSLQSQVDVTRQNLNGVNINISL